MGLIHPTAIVDPAAALASSVTVGPYAVIGADCASLPATLKVVGSAPAGGSYDASLQCGEAVRIGQIRAGGEGVVYE